MFTIPCTADHLRVQALRAPRRVAIEDSGAALTYGELDLLVRRCRRELRALGLGAGSRVAVAGNGCALGPQLVVLLAAESLGCTTASVAGDDDYSRAILGAMEHLFAAVPVTAPAHVQVHALDVALVRRWSSGEADERGAQLQLHQPARLASTSGTTGQPRLLLLSHSLLDWRIRTVMELPGWDHGPGTRLLVLAPLLVNAGYLRLSGALRRGGTVVTGPEASIAALAPTHIQGLPAQLARFLDGLPAGYAAPRRVEVGTFGGRVGAALADRVRAAFGSEVENRYGTNETSTVCATMDGEATGTLEAGVAVRILDDQGHDLPIGREGRIAVRSPAMVGGYHGDPVASAAAFRDGCFLTGDVGVMLAPRVLRLVGRHDELIAIAGLKVPAAVLEERLRRHPAVVDCAAFSPHDDADASLAVAVVLRPPVPALQDAGKALAAAMDLGAEARFRLLLLPELPRLPGGKVDRLRLLRLLRGP